MTTGNRTFLFCITLCLLLAALLIGLSGCTLTMSTEEHTSQQPVSEQPSQAEEPEDKPLLGSSAPFEEVLPWTGVWDSGQWGRMELVQKGNSVTGNYSWDDGKIQGTVSGNILSGTWSETPSYASPDDAGDFEFTLSSDGKSFSGRWRYGSSGDWDGDWSGEKTAEKLMLIGE